MVVDGWAWELGCGDAWLTSEGNVDGLLEHVWLLTLCGVFVGKTQEQIGCSSVFEEEHEKHQFRTWCGFCLCLFTLLILELKAQVADQTA